MNFIDPGMMAGDFQKYLHSFRKVEEKVLYILEHVPETRDFSNKLFVFAYWHLEHNFAPGQMFTMRMYKELTDPETIRRTKQRIVENNTKYAPSRDDMILEKHAKYQGILDWVIG